MLALGFPASRAVAVTAGLLLSLAGCGGDGGDVGSILPTTPPPATTVASSAGTGSLAVTITDREGQPLVDAYVGVFAPAQSRSLGATRTDERGIATFLAMPPIVQLTVLHPFGDYFRKSNLAVAQQGVTLHSLVLEPSRPQPTVALLPVSIPAEGVSADRRELLLQVTLVASASAPFQPPGYGDQSPGSTPSLRLAVGRWDVDTNQRPCFVWLDRQQTSPDCGPPSGDSSYTVAAERFSYEPAGTVPTLASRTPASSVMLLLDQSERVKALDPTSRRSFAARQMVARLLSSRPENRVSVAGFAGHGSSSALLPQQPLWPVLAGSSSSTFSADAATLVAAVSSLEPLLGGSAPLLAAMQAALAATAAQAPPGSRAVVALLGGPDDTITSDASRKSMLAALRRQRDAGDIQTVLVTGGPSTAAEERVAVAELASAMRAPVISLGLRHSSSVAYDHSWAAGAFAALDLAADLVEGGPLPTLSATFRVKATAAAGFASGSTLYGVLYVESDICPMFCQEFPVEFAAEIP